MPHLIPPEWSNVMNERGASCSDGVCAAATALWLRSISRAHVSFGHSTNNAAKEWAGGKTRNFCAALQTYFEKTQPPEMVLPTILGGANDLDGASLGPEFHNGDVQYDPFAAENNINISSSDSMATINARLSQFKAGHFGFISASHNERDGHAMAFVCLRTQGSFSKLIGTHPGTLNYYFFDPNKGIYNAATAEAIAGDILELVGPGKHWNTGAISFGQLWT